MKIIKLQAENVKKLVAVEIAPTGNLVQITGKNGQGKTSVLDSIMWALAGAKHIQAEPIRKGAKTALIKLDLGSIKVERRFTEKTDSLTVEAADGSKYPSPQKMLDTLLGELSFDPLAFARLKPKEQFDELKRIAKLEIDVDKLDVENKADYDRRTDINRQAKAKRAQAEAIVVTPGLPAEPVAETGLLDEISKAAEHNGLIEQRKLKRQKVADTVEEERKAATEKRQQAAELRKQADALDEEAIQHEATAEVEQERLDNAPALPEAIDIADVRRRLEVAQQVNAEIAKRDSRKKIEAEAEALEAQSQALTDAMEARTQAKQDAIAAADMPVEGLGFGDGVVTYNGVPFDQASSAEQLKVSLKIAMAANPKLKVIRIQDGSLLDEDSLAQVAEMAAENDYQVWLEKVDTSGKVGFVIEDGHVKAAPVAQAAE